MRMIAPAETSVNVMTVFCSSVYEPPPSVKRVDVAFAVNSVEVPVNTMGTPVTEAFAAASINTDQIQN